jgi:uncharacterized membrane protein (Fun14 family)
MFRLTSQALPEQIRSRMKEDGYLPIGVSVVGALTGMAVRHRFNGIVVMGTVMFFSIKLMVDYGLMTIHWDKIEELKQKVPLLGHLVAVLPEALETVLSVPLASFFLGGFVLGFRFG